MADLLGADVGSTDFDLLPEGKYSGVITGTEVKKGPKGPYIKVEVTIHDEGLRGRKVWRNAASFSDAALNIPGHAGNLVQATQPVIDTDLEVGELPAAIANEIISTPVIVEVKHEQVERDGKLQFRSDGEPEFRAGIEKFFEADEEFVQQIENEIAGVDDDLPF